MFTVFIHIIQSATKNNEKGEPRNIRITLGTIIALGVSYWFCRYPMLEFHGMYEWPADLAIASFFVLTISLFLKKYWLAVITVLGYIGGFFIALLFNTDGLDPGGGKTNNLWSIWMDVLLICIIIGIFIEIFRSKTKILK